MTKYVVTPLADRLASFTVKDEGGCWNFMGYRDRKGYGRLNRGRAEAGNILAHRAAWEVAHGQPAPAGLVVMHECDNRQCINPDHLKLGTYAENNHDMAARGRSHHPRGEGNPRAKLTAEQVDEIRAATASHKAIAAAYGMGETTVRNIRSGRLWASTVREGARYFRVQVGKDET